MKKLPIAKRAAVLRCLIEGNSIASTTRLRAKTAKRIKVQGSPDMQQVSTSYVERCNLSTRVSNRRSTRQTTGYSKKLANHKHILTIQFFCYNYVRRHLTLKKTPAGAVGISTRQWTMEEVVEVSDLHATRGRDFSTRNFSGRSFKWP